MTENVRTPLKRTIKNGFFSFTDHEEVFREACNSETSMVKPDLTDYSLTDVLI